MRCRITPILRAKATFARFEPRRLATSIPQRLSFENRVILLCDIFAMALSSHVPPLPESWVRGISYPWDRRLGGRLACLQRMFALARSCAKVAASGPLHDRRGR